jgi:membrane protease YdiL (CAAX protease family)
MRETMEYLEYILLIYLIFWPIYIYFTYEQEKQSVIAQPEKKIAAYRATMLQLWLPTLILLLLVSQNYISMSEIGLRLKWDLANQIGLAGLVLICGYFLLSLKQLSGTPQNHQAIREQLDYIKWFMPATAKESRYFILGISVTAGICEELLYRGYLIQLFAGHMPTYAAVIVSSIAFGLGHIYQGPIHILRTGLMGAVLALIYIATDSIILPIILHALLDMYGGALAYTVLKKQPAKVTVANA